MLRKSNIFYFNNMKELYEADLLYFKDVAFSSAAVGVASLDSNLA